MISNLMKMAESSPNRKKTLWEKEKLLITNNFSFFQCFQKTCAADKQDLFGKELSETEQAIISDLRRHS